MAPKNNKTPETFASPEQVAAYIAEAIEAFDANTDDILQIEDEGYGKLGIWFRDEIDYHVFSVEVNSGKREW